MANLNRDYLVTLDVKTSNVTLSSPMTFYVTDRRTMNIFVKLVMNMSDNPVIKDYVALENAVGYRTELVLVAPNNQPFYLEGELLNGDEALFCFNLDTEQISKIGDWVCELRVYSIVDADEEIVTSRSFLYSVNESITTSLDDVVLDNTTYGIIDELIGRIEDLESGSAGGENELKLNILEATKYDDVQVLKTEGKITLTFFANKTKMKTVEIPASEGLEQRVADCEESIAWLLENGGGGGGIVSAYLSTTDSENFVIPNGVDLELHLDFYSPNIGKGTLKILNNDVDIINTTLAQGETTIIIPGDLLTKGLNTIKAYAIDRTGNMTNTLQFNVRYGSTILTTTFDQYQIYDVGAVVRYYFTATALNTADELKFYMKIDDLVQTPVKCVSDERAYFTFPILDIGSHYCEAWVEDSYGKSNVIAFNFVVLDETSLAINSSTRSVTIEEGEQLSLDYRVYRRGDTKFNVSVFIDNLPVSSGECNADTNFYTTSNLTEGQHVIKIQAWDMYLTVSDYVTWIVTITPSTYEMKTATTTGAVALFTAKDRTNSDENKTTWTGKDQDGNSIVADLTNFSYNAESGWNNNELIISGKSHVEIPVAPLANNARYGFTLDIEFTSKQIGVEDAEVLTLWNEADNCGIKITTEKLIIQSKDGNKCDLYFSDNENVSAIFVIDRDEKTAKIYVNGVMCEAFHLSDYVVNGQTILEDFTVNSNIILGGGADKNGYCKIKNLRVYEVALSTNEILNNWLSNITSKTSQRDMVKFQEGNDLPTLTVYCDFAGLGKDDKKPCDIIYYSPDVTKYGESFTLSGKTSQLQYQGTSSMQYPIKNYRLNLRDAKGDKWYYNPYGEQGGQGECRFTLKADFMSSGHWQNTGLAKFVSDKLYGYKANDESTMNPAKWHSINNGGKLTDTRDSINGFPCRLILVNDGNSPLNEGQNEPTPGNTKDMGIFNFNNDKDNVSSLGLDTDIFPNALSFEVTANSDTSAGAFVPYGDREKTINGYMDGSTLYLNLLNNSEWNKIYFEVDGNTYLNSRMYFFNALDTSSAYDQSGPSTDDNGVFVDTDYRSQYPYVQIAFMGIGTGKKTVTLNGQTFNINYVENRLDLHKEPLSIAEEAGAELEYLQNSFELRYPDEDDVGKDYGYLGIPKILEVFEVPKYEQGTCLINIDYFGTNTFNIQGAKFSELRYVDVNYDFRPSVSPINDGTTVIAPNEARWIGFNIIGGENGFYINDKFYMYGVEVELPANNGIPQSLGQQTILDNTLGLKRVIDWVGNCTDEEFKADYEKYFDKHYLLRYYLLVITLGMVDNLGKNMMLDTWDGQIWYPRFYDMDTICSYDNSGAIKFDVDIEMEQGYWNTSSSRLWTKVRDLLHDELVVAYKDMRASGLSYDGLMNYFYGEQISKIPQKYYNQDYDVKYGPYADEYLGKAHGDGYEHLKRWLKNRIIFTDTLFDYGPSYESDMLTIRANTLEPITFEIETYTPVYQHVSYYNGQMSKLKIDGKTATTFTGNAQTATDQEILIYGGSNIKRIRGISSANPDSMLIGKATKLAELDISNCPILTEVNSNKANFAPHSYLNKLNIENCPNLGGTLELSNSPLIQEIKAKGTAVTGLRLPTSVKNLETLELPNTISTLALYDASSLETLKFDEGVAMQSIELSNCTGITNTENFDLTKTPTVILDNSYNTDELYMSETTNLTLRNMSNLERVIYTPNSEYSEFDINNVIGGKNYKVTTSSCPKLTTFMTTAPQRLSYNNGEHGNITPNTVFTANTLDLSSTQFTDIKLLCTTDVYNLKVPTTIKNFYCDSAMDIDTDVIEDASYEVIHEELIEPYTTNYEGEVYRYEEKYVEGYSIPQSEWQEGYQLHNGQLASQSVARVSNFFSVSPNTSFKAVSTGFAFNTVPYTGVSFYDENKNHIQYFGLYNPATVPSNGRYARISLSTQIAIDEFTINYTGVIPHTPNIIPSSASGSLIFNMYSNNTTQPTSTSPYMWDLTGLKLNDFHTYGMNNNVKASDDSYIKIANNTELVHAQGVTKRDAILGSMHLAESNSYKSRGIGVFKLKAGSYTFTTDNNTSMTIRYSETIGGIQSFSGGGTSSGSVCNYSKDMYFCINLDNTAKWLQINDTRFVLSEIRELKLSGDFNLLDHTTVVEELSSHLKLSEIQSITMPQRMPGYSVRLVNADITPNEYPTMLYPKWIDTGLPITGKLDYTAYNGTSLAWAYAYTTGNVEISPLGSQHQGNITQDYNKLYGTDFVDIRDVWVYKDTDVSNFSTNEAITKAYIELTQNNYETRIDDVLKYYPNCTDVYLFDDGNVVNLQFMYSNGGHNNANKTRQQVQNITFMEGYFEKLEGLMNAFTSCTNLVTVNNIPKSVKDFRNCFEACEKLNCQFDFSDYNVETENMKNTFINCKALTRVPVLPQGITSMQGTFQGCSSLTTAPTIPQGVTNMEHTFNSCKSLTQAPNIPQGVTNMNCTFYNCTSLTTPPTIPNGVTSVYYAFYSCASLTTVPTIPNSVTNMAGAFYKCTSLTQAPNIPNGVTNISMILALCEKVTSITLPLANIQTYNGALNSTGITDITWVGERNSDFDITSLYFNGCSQEDIQELVPEHLADLTTLGTTATLTLGETYLAYLTEEEIAQAVAKGWTIQ